MTLNFNYPAVAKVFYTLDGLNHVHQVGLNVHPSVLTQPAGDLPDLYELVSIGTPQFEAWANTYINGSPAHVPPFKGFKYFMGTDCTIDRVELWRYLPGTNTGQYLTVVPFGIAGDGGGIGAVGGSMIFTLRTAEGGIMRAVFMEGRMTDMTSQTAFSGIGPDTQAFVTWQYLSTDSPVIGKDGSKPISFLKRSNSQSEVIFRARYR